MILRGLLAPLSAGRIVTAIAGTFHFVGIRVNASASLPIALYRITSEESASLIEFCPTEPFGSLSANRAYRGKGNCPNGAEPLMKPIVAVAGEVVTTSVRDVTVSGRLLANSAPLAVDTKNRPLKHWPFGEYRVLAGTVWVVFSYDARSFDSRYFGPIPISSIRSHLLPFMPE